MAGGCQLRNAVLPAEGGHAFNRLLNPPRGGRLHSNSKAAAAKKTIKWMKTAIPPSAGSYRTFL